MTGPHRALLKKLARGPGYRIYLAREGLKIIVLIGGGTKKQQQKNINHALALWKNYKQGKLPKAIITADILGQAADLDRILNVCNQYNIPVVSDSAEALGATYKDRHAGQGAAFTVYSFNGNKIITTSGGGMLASDDAVLIEKAKFLSQQARDAAPHYEHTQIGYNYRMSNIVAAIGRGQLRVLDERVEKKRWIFDYYQKALADIPGIEFMPEAHYGRATRWLTVILITPEKFGADREAIRQVLEKENIESRPVWKPMHMQLVFKGSPMRGGAVCEDLFARGLCLPSGTAMTETDLERIVNIITVQHQGTSPSY